MNKYEFLINRKEINCIQDEYCLLLNVYVNGELYRNLGLDINGMFKGCPKYSNDYSNLEELCENLEKEVIYVINKLDPCFIYSEDDDELEIKLDSEYQIKIESAFKEEMNKRMEFDNKKKLFYSVFESLGLSKKDIVNIISQDCEIHEKSDLYRYIRKRMGY